MSAHKRAKLLLKLINPFNWNNDLSVRFRIFLFQFCLWTHESFSNKRKISSLMERKTCIDLFFLEVAMRNVLEERFCCASHGKIWLPVSVSGHAAPDRRGTDPGSPQQREGGAGARGGDQRLLPVQPAHRPRGRQRTGRPQDQNLRWACPFWPSLPRRGL